MQCRVKGKDDSVGIQGGTEAYYGRKRKTANGHATEADRAKECYKRKRILQCRVRVMHIHITIYNKLHRCINVNAYTLRSPIVLQTSRFRNQLSTSQLQNTYNKLIRIRISRGGNITRPGPGPRSCQLPSSARWAANRNAF